MKRNLHQNLQSPSTFIDPSKHEILQTEADLNESESFVTRSTVQSTPVSDLSKKTDDSPDSGYSHSTYDLDSDRPITSLDTSSSISFEAYGSRGQSTPIIFSPNKKTDSIPDPGYSGSFQHLYSSRPITSSDKSSPIPSRQSHDSTGDWNSNSFKFPKHVSSPSYNWTVYAPFAFNTKELPSRRRSMSETGTKYTSSSNLLSFQENGIDFDDSMSRGLPSPEIESRPIIKDVDLNFFCNYDFRPLNAKSRSLNGEFDTSVINCLNLSNPIERCAEVKGMETYDYRGNVDINVVGKERETGDYQGNVCINVVGKERETGDYQGNVSINIVGKERKMDDYQGSVGINFVGKEREIDNYRGNFDTKFIRKEKTSNQVNFEPKAFSINETGTKNSRNDFETAFKLKSYVEREKQVGLSTSEACGKSSMFKMESYNVVKNENDNTDFNIDSDIFYKSFMKLNAEIQRKIENINTRILNHLNPN